MEFTWDSAKARRNLAKHGISFDLARRVWDDPQHVLVPDRFEDGEHRWHAIGLVGAVSIILVVHIYPDDEDDERVRIIGARKATRREKTCYEEQQA